MDIQEILSNLCYYDKRNPDNILDDDNDIITLEERKKKGCFCDNCFYGRTKLAEELLKYIKL